ncbi:hypothetical protein EON66_04755 [archaeon]|nr:MAG: hypothetical protein EON66_04755 [archaeon]
MLLIAIVHVYFKQQPAFEPFLSAISSALLIPVYVRGESRLLHCFSYRPSHPHTHTHTHTCACQRAFASPAAGHHTDSQKQATALLRL